MAYIYTVHTHSSGMIYENWNLCFMWWVRDHKESQCKFHPLIMRQRNHWKCGNRQLSKYLRKILSISTCTPLISLNPLVFRALDRNLTLGVSNQNPKNSGEARFFELNFPASKYSKQQDFAGILLFHLNSS